MNNDLILIIGGTGSLGKTITRILLADSNARLRVLARDEHKLNAMEAEFTTERIDYFQGDIRDAERLESAMKDVDYVYHLAAIKTVDGAENNPLEAVKTNILGTSNVISACHANNVKAAIFTSTDKACAPITHYGTTKQTAENLFINGNIGKRHDRCKFAAVRYGNVVGSKGSVAEVWDQKTILPVTSLDMTRFYWSKEDAARFCIFALDVMDGGEVFIPNLKSCTNYQLVQAFNKPFQVVGLRCAEKLHEDLISIHESPMVHYWDKYGIFIKYPFTKQFLVKKVGEKVPSDFYFNSYNAQRLTQLEIRNLLINSGYAKELEVKEWLKSRCA